MSLYRVRHPAGPGLWVWWVETFPQETHALGTTKRVHIYFASPREGMTKGQAEEMAALCGGTVEEVVL